MTDALARVAADTLTSMSVLKRLTELFERGFVSVTGPLESSSEEPVLVGYREPDLNAVVIDFEIITGHGDDAFATIGNFIGNLLAYRIIHPGTRLIWRKKPVIQCVEDFETQTWKWRAGARIAILPD